MKKLSYKYCNNKEIRTRANGNFQSHEQEESKLSSTRTVEWNINANSGVHALAHD